MFRLSVFVLLVACSLSAHAQVIPVVAIKRAVSAPMPARSAGLIDIAYVFKKYERFTENREELKERFEKYSMQLRRAASDIQALQHARKSTKDAKKTAELDAQLAAAMAKAETMKRVRQLELVQAEATFYKQAYLDVQAEVARVAKSRGLVMIFRFDREQMSSNVSDPQAIKRIMQRPLIYYEKNFDITDAVLKNLNRSYRNRSRE